MPSLESKVISISVPVMMLKRIDEAAARSYQSRSNFIRMAIVEKFGANSQYELSRPIWAEPDMRTDKQNLKLYDYEEELEEYLKEIEEGKD